MAAASLKTEMTPSSHVFPDRDFSLRDVARYLCDVARAVGEQEET